MNHHALFDELLKLGAISDQQAQHSIDRLDSLEKSKVTPGQVGRYGAVGALATPAISAIGNMIEKKPPIGSLRALGSQAVKGALTGSAIPIARQALDRRAEVGTLKKYLAQEHVGPYATSPGASTDV